MVMTMKKKKFMLLVMMITMMLAMPMPAAMKSMLTKQDRFMRQPRTELRQPSPAVRRDGGPVGGRLRALPLIVLGHGMRRVLRAWSGRISE